MTSNKRCEDSFGPIAEEEDVAYGLYSPDVFDPDTGELTPQAIQLEHLLGNKGQHIDRCGHSSGVSVSRLADPTALEQLWQVLELIAAKRYDRQLEGYAVASVREIWNIESPINGVQPLDVLDDGRADYTSHAVIRGSPKLTRGALRGARSNLVLIFNSRVIRRS